MALNAHDAGDGLRDRALLGTLAYTFAWIDLRR